MLWFFGLQDFFIKMKKIIGINICESCYIVCQVQSSFIKIFSWTFSRLSKFKMELLCKLSLGLVSKYYAVMLKSHARF